MQKQNSNTSKTRKGDTSRTSSQGRKESSGGDTQKTRRGQSNEETSSRMKDEQRGSSPSRPRKA